LYFHHGLLGAATQAMWCIVEEWQRRRCPPAAALRRTDGSEIYNIHR
jgi:hypothetical protein